MLRNYIITALRVMSRNRFYSGINLLGLSIGLTSLILALAYIQDEKSYDRFHHKAENIYRVVGSLNLDGQGENPASCVFGLGPAMINDYPHLVDKTVRFFNFQDPQHTLSHEDIKHNESGIFMVDSTVFDVFDFPLISGDPGTALHDPNTIVIDRVLAQKYFGTDDVIGKIVRFDDMVDLKVTGVLKELPVQSHIHFNGLVSFSTLRNIFGPNLEKNWVWNPCWTYLLLKDGVTAEDVNPVFPSFVKKYYPEHLKTQVTHELQPLKDIHLTSHLDFELEQNGQEETLYIFGGVGLFVIIIAMINFMNLTTARSTGRRKETGVRKSIGAQRSQLVLQFLLESFLMSFFALFLTLAFIELFLPVFNHIAGKSIRFSDIWNARFIAIMLGCAVLTGLLAGIYPAFYMSGFKPLTALKPGLVIRGRGIGFRQFLVVFQFVITGILLVFTGMVYRQFVYLQTAELGFEKEQVVLIPVRPSMAKSFVPFVLDLRNENRIAGVALMNDVIGKKHNNHEYNFKDMADGNWVYYPTLIIDEAFIPTMKIPLVAGRNFSKDFPREDSLSIIINEAMAKQMGWTPEEAVGQRFNSLMGKEHIIGVVRDFNFVSLLQPVKPFVLDLAHPQMRVYWTRYIAVRLHPGDHATTISLLEEKWNKYSNAFPFDYFFLDQDLKQQYVREANLARLVGTFSVIAIVIACLGLFALASFTAEQKTKELGIRKVMGASPAQLILMLTGTYLRLILFANLLALPAAYFFVRRWQEDFAYQAPMDYSLFVMAFLLTLFIATLTVIFQAYRAAVRNPVKALRYE